MGEVVFFELAEVFDGVSQFCVEMFVVPVAPTKGLVGTGDPRKVDSFGIGGCDDDRFYAFVGLPRLFLGDFVRDEQTVPGT